MTMMIAGGLAGFGAGVFYLSGIGAVMVQQTSGYRQWDLTESQLRSLAAASDRNPVCFLLTIQHITSAVEPMWSTTLYCTQI